MKQSTRKRDDEALFTQSLPFKEKFELNTMNTYSPCFVDGMLATCKEEEVTQTAIVIVNDIFCVE